MFKILLSVSIWTVFLTTGFAQNTDCSNALAIIPDKMYHAEKAPANSGKIMELKANDAQQNYFFEREHHTAWYYFEVPDDGILTMTISPDQIQDDYDWLLFKKRNENFCKEILTHQLLPLRTNIARNDKNIFSKTGMSPEGLHELEGPGKNPSFSKPVSVKKGEVYYLVLDNVYKHGKGHRIELHIAKENKKKQVQGSVRSALSHIPLDATIIVEDHETGDSLRTVFADSLNGTFHLLLEKNKTYNITCIKDNYFNKTENINVSDSISSLELLLDTFLLGESFTLFNIRFEANNSSILKNSKGDLKRLLDFMLKNPRIIIEIRGHTNFNLFSDRNYLFQLSFNRAKEVKLFLTKNGIDPARINCTGMGGSSPLIISDNQEKAMKNLRVEIVLIDELR